MDNVNHPKHYTQGGIECIDALAAATSGLEGIEAVDTANAIKYLWRWKYKNGVEDVNKAMWYLNHLKNKLQPQVKSSNVTQSVNWVPQQASIISDTTPFKQIERCARLCYKSEDKITEDSYRKICNNLYKNKHLAMFEHAIFHFLITEADIQWYEDLLFIGDAHKYCVVTKIEDYKYILTTNLRALLEQPQLYFALKGYIEGSSGEKLFFEPLYEVTARLAQSDHVSPIGSKTVAEFLSPERAKKHLFATLKFTTDIGVANELVRHRNSFAQESTRYVNYGNKGIQFVKPVGYDLWTSNVKESFEDSLMRDVKTYNEMISNGRTPQEARDVLPKCLKTEIIMTASLDNWEHFLDLRYRETTGKAHPKMKELATLAYQQLKDIEEYYPDSVK